WTSSLFARFFHWYAPYFSAYSFALARTNEYEADAVAASLTSPHAVGSALTAISALTVFDFERYWASLFKRADHELQAPGTVWSDYANYAVHRHVDQAEGRALIAQCLAQETSYADTHPSLRDRLDALHMDADLASAPQPLAAETWLTPVLVS